MTNHQSALAAPVEMREAFEEAMRNKGFNVARDFPGVIDTYVSRDTGMAWEGWQAALAVAAPLAQSIAEAFQASVAESGLQFALAELDSVAPCAPPAQSAPDATREAFDAVIKSAYQRGVRAGRREARTVAQGSVLKPLSVPSEIYGLARKYAQGWSDAIEAISAKDKK